jgi:hypothetical protein
MVGKKVLFCLALAALFACGETPDDEQASDATQVDISTTDEALKGGWRVVAHGTWAGSDCTTILGYGLRIGHVSLGTGHYKLWTQEHGQGRGYPYVGDKNEGGPANLPPGFLPFTVHHAGPKDLWVREGAGCIAVNVGDWVLMKER